MTGITTMTQKGQITIPIAMRKALGMEPFKRVTLMMGDGYVKVEPVEDLLDMAGSVKPVKGRSALKARAWMEKYYKRI